MELKRTGAAGAGLADTSVVVIGGGFGGLSAACYLAQAGTDVELVEKNDQLGGRAQTVPGEKYSRLQISLSVNEYSSGHNF